MQLVKQYFSRENNCGSYAKSLTLGAVVTSAMTEKAKM